MRGATVVDGLGRDARRADVAVEDGRITAIGELREDARETVDAGRLTLAPGIVDLQRGLFDLVEGVRRLTSHQADLYGIEGRGRIEVGAHADLHLFDPATVGVSPARRVAGLPGGGRRTVRDPKGVHGVFVNGVRVFDGENYVRHGKGPGRVFDRFPRVEGPLPP